MCDSCIHDLHSLLGMAELLKTTSQELVQGFYLTIRKLIIAVPASKNTDSREIINHKIKSSICGNLDDTLSFIPKLMRFVK